MKEIKQLKKYGIHAKQVAKLVNISYMVLHRYMKGTGRELTEAEQNRIKKLLMGIKMGIS